MFVHNIFYLHSIFLHAWAETLSKNRRNILRNKYMCSREAVQFWVGIWVNWRKSKGQFLLQDPKQTLALVRVFFLLCFFKLWLYPVSKWNTVCKLKLGLWGLM